MTTPRPWPYSDPTGIYHYELFFDGRDEVALIADPRLSPAEVADTARRHGYEFSRGKRSGRYGQAEYWLFRLLYPATGIIT